MSTAPPPPDETPAEQAGDPGTVSEAAETPARRRWFRRSPPAEASAAAEGPPAGGEGAPEAEGATEAIPPVPRPEGPRELRRTRERLITEREDAVYHLGGLAFELYRRDRLSDEVMRLKAGQVAEIDDTVRDIDARLSEVERERKEKRVRTPPDPSVGCCMTCRTTFRAEARFCWQCGTRVVPDTIGDEQPTAAIPVPPAT